MSVFLDILCCYRCCCDDPDSDNNFHEIYTANSSAKCTYTNVIDSSSCQKNRTVTSPITPLLYDHYPNYYKKKESTLEKSNQTSHNAKTSSPLLLQHSSKPQSSPVFPKPSSQPITSLNRKSTLSSYLTPSGSINASSSSSSFRTNSVPLTSPKLQTTTYLSSPSPLFSGLTQSSVNQLVSSTKLPSPTPKPSKTSSRSSPSTTSLPEPLPTSNPTLRPASSSKKNAQEYVLDANSSFSLNLVPKDVSSSKLTTPTPKPSKTSSLPSPSTTSLPEPPPTSNPTLRSASSSKKNGREYILDANNSLPLYLVPKDVEDLIKNDIVPQVLRKPLSPLTYKSYFAALLHAEDVYYKKWSNYKLESVSLELQQITIHKGPNKKTKLNSHEKVIKTFVAFEIDSVPERRPFLLSRDLVHARLCEKTLEPFQGFVYRIAKSNCPLGKKNVLLVDFGEEFYARHRGTNKYDISFTFNRVCLKRAHQAIEEASDSLFQNFLFPKATSRKVQPYFQFKHSSHQQLDHHQKNAMRQISHLHGSPPYLIKGPPYVEGVVFQIYSTSPNCKILICAPRNATCDELMISLKKVIPDSKMFRATAAFRERDEVPEDILPLCDYNEFQECFTCPELDELHKYKIILTTFMSSYRLHAKGLVAGHFSHIFLLDASKAIEPEVLVPLTKFVIDTTNVIVTGETGKQPSWVRSMIARKHGLRTSYFERLGEMMPYRSNNPSFISEL